MFGTLGGNKCACPLRRTFKSSSLRTVTHVLVSDPTKGYAVFADLMVKQMREVE